MASLTQEQIEQKKLQLKQLVEEARGIAKELEEAGVLELSEEDLKKAAGGVQKVNPSIPFTYSNAR